MFHSWYSNQVLIIHLLFHRTQTRRFLWFQISNFKRFQISTVVDRQLVYLNYTIFLKISLQTRTNKQQNYTTSNIFVNMQVRIPRSWISRDRAPRRRPERSISWGPSGEQARLIILADVRCAIVTESGDRLTRAIPWPTRGVWPRFYRRTKRAFYTSRAANRERNKCHWSLMDWTLRGRAERILFHRVKKFQNESRSGVLVTRTKCDRFFLGKAD